VADAFPHGLPGEECVQIRDIGNLSRGHSLQFRAGRNDSGLNLSGQQPELGIAEHALVSTGCVLGVGGS